MTIKTKLENALKDAMRSNDEVARRTIRMALSAIKLAEVEKGTLLEDNDLAAILHKEIKSRKETIQEAEKATRLDLVEAAKADILVLEKYLPKAMDPAELERITREVIHEVGATGITDMGKVMKALLPRLEGRAPNDQVSHLVRLILQP
ncbi:MAG: GatB/YqeY domain-containing protein [Anaerolineaceae bacterium]|nr:GatB/YqeY domain-containing protein [Anaerolineaceae bacterium]MBN2677047.1 GatB/YqeY domain-containing protein [Anaerolineaceae bacterium]